MKIPAVWILCILTLAASATFSQKPGSGEIPAFTEMNQLPVDSGTDGEIHISQFRGAGHSGTYDEKNLLKRWPEGGPAMIWINEQIGNGFGSPAVTDSQVFVQGEKDSVSWVYSFNLKGILLWKNAIGREVMSGSWTGSFSTPTVVNDLVYALSSDGDINCLQSSTGEKVWQFNMIRDLKGKMVDYGFSQSLLVEGDLLFCSPGGSEYNTVALNRFTGEVRWSSPGTGEEPRCSPVIISRGEKNTLITTSVTSVTGTDPLNGKLIWTEVIDTSGNSHYNTPLFDGENIYCSTFYNGLGVVSLHLSEDGSKVTRLWSTQQLLNSIGGLIKMGGWLVGTHEKMLVSLDLSDGHRVDSIQTGGNMGGATIAADGMIYLYTDSGKMMLMNFESGKLDEVSSFRVTKGTRNHFAHPVIKDGILYVRHGRALIAYSISRQN
jgi:outer membrane protein assembly factor BamB